MSIVIGGLLLINCLLYIFSIFLPNLKILQLEEYSLKKLIKYNLKYRKYLVFGYLIDIVAIVTWLILPVELRNYAIVFSLCLLSIYYVIILFKFKLYNIYPKYTHRIIRIFIIFLLLLLINIVLSLYYKYMFILIVILTIVYTILTISSHIIIKIYELILLHFFIKKASKKIKNNKLIKIGITGSYGKTSVKQILDTILKEKYSVLSTPKSYNTPSGLALTINNNNLSNYDVIIMEMGAKKIGDIKLLCKYFNPNHGIITAIGKQHLEEFGSIENIVKAKSELIDGIDVDGVIVTNNDNSYTNKLICEKDKICVGVDTNADIEARNIKLNSESSIFDIYYKGDFFIDVETSLVGRHNIINILLAVGMAINLGLNAKQIKKGIIKLKSIDSRMEKIILSNGVIVINNGYNSNPSSAEASLQLLILYKDKYKIVITPGFVEMGKEQYDLNYKFGEQIAKMADKCIVVNKVNREAIINGLKSKGFNNYCTVDKFKNIDFKKFKNGDVVLIENDLPDNYV